MDDQQKPEFVNCIGGMYECYGREASRMTFCGYWMALRDLDLTQVQNAIMEALRSCTTVPTAAELREFVTGKSEDRALLAWGDAEKAASRHGPYKHVSFSDPLINATIRNLGGWPQFVERFSSADSEKWLRLDFLKTYKSFSRSGVNGEACQALPGLSQSTAIGGKVVEPKVVPVAVSYQPTQPKLISGNGGFGDRVAALIEEVA
ncbi:MAG: hypothetical protein NXI32_19140 [bacterium]|nr:hypothetical protein [bacterium]